MQVRIRVVAVDGQPGTHDLFQWLSSDADTARGVDLELVDSQVTPDALGAMDVIQAVLSDVTSIGSLVVAIATWNGSRGREASVHLEHRGQSFPIEDPDHESVGQLSERLRAGEAGHSPAAEGSVER